MKALRRFAPLALSLSAPLAVAAGTLDLRGYLGRVPALPANAAAAATAFPRGADGSIAVPPTAQKLRADLQAAAMAAATAPTAGAAAPMTPDQAQAMAQKLQSMSQSEQMAYAMQMQQQMLAGNSGGFSVSAAESDALGKLEDEQVRVNEDEQRFIALKQRSTALLAAWDAAVRSSSEFAIGDAEVCNEQHRARALAQANAEVDKANEQLRKAATLDKELRAADATLIARAELTTSLAAQIKTSALAAAGTTARTRATSNAINAIDLTADFYAQAGRRAARWQHLADAIRKAPSKPDASQCQGGSGL
jgi:hypothetical protein